MIFQTRQQLEVHSRENARSMYCGDGVSVCQILADMKLFVVSHDVTMTPHLAFDGVWEPWITTFVQSRVQRGMSVVNVGAAYGYYAQICGQIGADVIAYEAQEHLAKLIGWSTQANGFHKNVEVRNALVSNNPGVHDLFTDKHRVGGATAHAHGGERYSIANSPRRAVVLDFDVPPRFARNLDFMIIDVEGHEPEVIDGAKGIIEGSPNLELVMEVTPGWYDKKTGPSFWSYLEDRFDVYYINNDGGTTQTTVEELQKEDQATVLFARHGWLP